MPRRYPTRARCSLISDPGPLLTEQSRGGRARGIVASFAHQNRPAPATTPGSGKFKFSPPESEPPGLRRGALDAPCIDSNTFDSDTNVYLLVSESKVALLVAAEVRAALPQRQCWSGPGRDRREAARAVLGAHPAGRAVLQSATTMRRCRSRRGAHQGPDPRGRCSDIPGAAAAMPPHRWIM